MRKIKKFNFREEKAKGEPGTALKVDRAGIGAILGATEGRWSHPRRHLKPYCSMVWKDHSPTPYPPTGALRRVKIVEGLYV